MEGFGVVLGSILGVLYNVLTVVGRYEGDIFKQVGQHVDGHLHDLINVVGNKQL